MDLSLYLSMLSFLIAVSFFLSDIMVKLDFVVSLAVFEENVEVLS